MRILKLKPPQQIRVFGWMGVKPYLQWQDIEKSPVITFRFLREMGLTPVQLHLLQPDASAWLRYGGVTMDDCHEMAVWPIHPCNDLGATLDKIMTRQWSPLQMMQVGLSLAELTNMGMSVDNMVLFGFGLTGWIEMGLDREYLNSMADDQVRRVFAISRTQVLHALPILPHMRPPPIEHALVRPIRSTV
jgi:hypothetical protein